MTPKWKRGANDNAVTHPSSKRSAIDQNDRDFSDQEEIDAELSSINNLLEEEETSQKQTWQIGKRVKKLLENHENLPISKELDAYFLWGTALTRLASLNEDPILANAAVDKFEQMIQLNHDKQDTAEEDAIDEALGPVGFSLWGSALLIIATETLNEQVLDQALTKLERAIQVDGGTTFETRFQFAKALKEGGELMAFLAPNDGRKRRNYYAKALQVCSTLQDIYSIELEKNKVQEGSDDDDQVTSQDFAQVKLLEAVLQGLLEDSGSVEDFCRTITLYQEASVLSPESAEAVMEKTNYLAARCLAKTTLGAKPTVQEWTKLFDNLEAEYKSLLIAAGFDLIECHYICHRKDTHNQEELEDEEVDERVPHLLNTLGKGLAAFVRSFPHLDYNTGQRQKKKQKRKRHEVAGNARFTHAVEVLRTAHHFHDKLGSYYLACLYASPAFEDEAQCRIWLETADSYGALEDEFDAQEFSTMHNKTWFKRLTEPKNKADSMR
ncbi:unnamed protein product [Peronospora belbahrii]|uniref:KIF-binding protein n=1 Tax=Peronospora belbahrii TaxID=622444 RepID=A0AAU9KZ57_9STRA|nr:unnamed protein product [Peronospora belbahrii]